MPEEIDIPVIPAEQPPPGRIRWGRLVNALENNGDRFAQAFDEAMKKAAEPILNATVDSEDRISVANKLGYTDFLNKNPGIKVYRTVGSKYGTAIRVPHDGRLITIFKENGQDRFKIINEDKNMVCIGLGIADSVLRLLKVRLKSADESAKIFGYAASKKKMFKSGATFKVEELIPKFKCKKDGKIRDCVTILNESSKALKFILGDLELIYPDISKMLKGYTPPKDRTIVKGSQVRIVRKTKGSGLALDAVGIVKKVEKVGKVPYYSVEMNGNLHKIRFGKLKKIK